MAVPRRWAKIGYPSLTAVCLYFVIFSGHLGFLANQKQAHVNVYNPHNALQAPGKKAF